MNTKNVWLQRIGLTLHSLIAALMVFAGSGKAFGFAPPQIIEKMKTIGMGEHIQLVGLGEMFAAILMLIPRTSPLGVLLTSGFWGGVICIHMANGQDFVFPSVLLALTWLGADLRGSISMFLSPDVVVTEKAVSM